MDDAAIGVSPVPACPFRRGELTQKTAHCDLVATLSGNTSRARVDQQICGACGKATSSTPGKLNPVAASLLFGATHERLHRSDLDTPERGFLTAMHRYATDCLETTAASTSATRPGRIAGSPESKGENGRKPKYPRTRSFLRRWPSIGLVGSDKPSGLGYQNRGIARNLPIKKWLVPGEELREVKGQLDGKGVTRIGLVPERKRLEDWLRGLEWLLFVETPLIASLVPLAKTLGVRIACVCNWEWTCPATSPWLQHVDLMICPTVHTGRTVEGWKRAFGFHWQIACVRWPIESERFPFRLRKSCERYLFINGHGGSRACRTDGTTTAYRRKGIETLLHAAELVPEVPILIHSQQPIGRTLPRNVELLQSPADNRELYRHGDVCVQPSHWEGLGMQLLECQSAGMPLITTDAAPMNEYRPLETVAVEGTEPLILGGLVPVPSQLISPHVLADTLSKTFRRDIRTASAEAQQFVKREHSWRTFRHTLYPHLAAQ